MSLARRSQTRRSAISVAGSKRGGGAFSTAATVGSDETLHPGVIEKLAYRCGCQDSEVDVSTSSHDPPARKPLSRHVDGAAYG